jgi:hypothetical protein
MRFIKMSGLVLTGLVALYFVGAFAAAFWPVTVFESQPHQSAEMLAAQQRAAGVITDQVYSYHAQHFVSRDGTQLFSRVFEAQSDTTILLLHGVIAQPWARSRCRFC